MKSIVKTPEASQSTSGFVNLSQAWIADRNHILNYRIEPITNNATWQIWPQACFLALDLVERNSSLHFQSTPEGPKGIFQLYCSPRHQAAQRLMDELPEAEMVVIGKLAASDDYLVLGLEYPVVLQEIKWPALNKRKMPYTALQLVASKPHAPAYLLPELVSSLAGPLPELEEVSPPIGNGVFNQTITLRGQHFFGTKRVWWGEQACDFQVINGQDGFELLVEIPSGGKLKDQPFVVLNQAGKSVEVLTYTRF
jgi:hypothetical protein